MKRMIVLASVLLLAVPAAPLSAWQDEHESAAASRGTSASAERPEWEIVFDDDITPEEYARQLDFFDIEIAAVASNGKIEYISDLTEYKPSKRVGYVESDYRLHIGWKSGTLHAADRRLLRKAGIASTDKELTHYFSEEVQKAMEVVEESYAGRKHDAIRSTLFQIRPKAKGKGYEFAVVEQNPPKPSESGPVDSGPTEKSQNRPGKP